MHSPSLFELAKNCHPLGHQFVQLFPILAQQYTFDSANLKFLHKFLNLIFGPQVRRDAGEAYRPVSYSYLAAEIILADLYDPS
jgi:hypothetical protein